MTLTGLRSIEEAADAVRTRHRRNDDTPTSSTPIIKMVSIASFLAVGGLSASKPDISGVNNEERIKQEPCTPCEDFFNKLKLNEENGLLSQAVKVQERVEPKSGTGMMFDWATAALVQTCGYLQGLFGEVTSVAVLKYKRTPPRGRLTLRQRWHLRS